MEAGNSIVFFLKAVLFGIAAVIFIPKEHYKKFFIYGFIFGGIGDTVIVLIFGKALHLIRYFNMGPFAVLGMFSFWTPIAWTFTFMLFLYLIPTRRVYLYLHILGFVTFGYMVGQVLEGFGLYRLTGAMRYFAPLEFLVWFSVVAWVYIRCEKIQLK